MAVRILKDGRTDWSPEPKHNNINLCSRSEHQTKQLGERQEKTIIATARAMRMDLSDEEKKFVIEKNAQCVEMTPYQLETLSGIYNDYIENNNSNSIEKE